MQHSGHGIGTGEMSQGTDDIRHFYPDVDTLFVVCVISSAMKRGVKHYKLDGTPLHRLSDIIDAIYDDGEVLMDSDGLPKEAGH